MGRPRAQQPADQRTQLLRWARSLLLPSRHYIGEQNLMRAIIGQRILDALGLASEKNAKAHIQKRAILWLQGAELRYFCENAGIDYGCLYKRLKEVFLWH